MDNPITNSNPSESNAEGQFGDAEVVIFNLDTTQKSTKRTEICQIAAWCKGKTFNECILPNDITDLQLSSENGFIIKENTLFHYKKEVNAFSPKDGLQHFLDFLSALTNKSRKVLLAAHNCSSFHRHIITRLMKQYGLFDAFKLLVLGFIDTMDVFKATLKVRKILTLEKLEKYYLKTNTQQKHAVVNVKILVDLIEKICTDGDMKKHARTLDEFIRYIDLQTDLEPAVTKKTLMKIAKAGITTDMLKFAYKANPKEGISKLFQGVDGKDPVKMQQSKIEKITERVSTIMC